MLLETVSQPLARALTLCGQADFFQLPPLDSTSSALAVEPGVGQDPGLTGVYSTGKDGDRCANRLCLVPFGQGASGQTFFLRVYGWRMIIGATGTLGGPPLWLPTLLIEMACTLGNQTGPNRPNPGGPPPNFLLADNENLCAALAVTNGTLGLGGFLCNNGPDFPALGFVDLQGVQKIQFDFSRPEEADVCGNCLWCRA